MAPESVADDDTTVSLRAILNGESRVQLQSLLLGLTVDDLEALASLPSHPHRTVHLLLAMVYLILHESAIQRDSLPPSMVLLTWVFLRENLLRNCAALFLRLQRRRFHNPVHPTISHVCVLYLRDPSFRIHALRKVSGIAAALASWVLLCLQAAFPCAVDIPDAVDEPHTDRKVQARPSLRFGLRLHGKNVLCLVRRSSHDITMDVCSPNSFHRTTVRRRDRAFADLADHTLAPSAFRAWMQHVLSACVVDNIGARLPHLLPVYFVVVRPPHVVGVGQVLATPSTSLRQCRRAIQDRYGWTDMAMYHRGSVVSTAMETTLDVRYVLPIALLGPRVANHRALAPALDLVHRLAHSATAMDHHREGPAPVVMNLPHVTTCPMYRSVADSALAPQLSSLFGLWATHGHECVVETCFAQSVARHEVIRVESSDVDPAGPSSDGSPKRRAQIPRKDHPYAAELHELARKLHIFTEVTYRFVPLHVHVSLDLVEVSATTERYNCELVSSAMDPSTPPGDVFTPGAVLRLVHGCHVTVESGWNDDVRGFGVSRPAIDKQLPSSSSVWLVVEAHRDKRPQWLHDVQVHIYHPTIEFEGRPDCFKYFGITLPFLVPEQLVEATLWSRHVDWAPIVAKTPCDALVDAKFHELCASFPANFFIDSVKFSKFIRDCRVLPSKLAMGSLDGIFHRFAMLRFQMDLEGFRAAIALVVHHVTRAHRRATTNPLLYFFLHYMILSPSMRGIWDQTMQTYRIEAKMLAMDALARQICAATRLQASYRGYAVYCQYKHHWTLMRRRRQAATTIVSCFKMLFCMRQFEEMKRIAAIEREAERARLEKLRREEAERAFLLKCRVALQVWVKYRLWKKRRFRLACPDWIAHIQRLRTRKRLLITRAACHIGGHLMLVTIFRCHIDQTKDSKLHLELYQAADSRTFVYDVHESTLQDVWAAVDDRPKPDPSELRSRLEGLLRRLHVNTTMHRVKMHASDDQCGRGRLMARMGCQVRERSRGVAAVFLHHFHVDLLLYDPSDCRATKWVLDIAFVQKVLQSAQTGFAHPWTCCGIALSSACRDSMSCRRRVAHALECDLNDFGRPFLHILIKYVVTHGTTSPAPELFLPPPIVQVTNPVVARRLYSMEERFDAASRLQAVWMGFRTRQAVADMLQGTFDISYDRRAGHLWYQSRTTGHYFASPPLGRILAVTYPPPRDEWLPQSDGHGSVYYFNPSRGVTSWFNLDTATRKVQRVFRCRRHAAIGRLSLQHLATAVAYHQFTTGSNKVTSDTSSTDIERMALHNHTITHNFSKAIALYEQLLQSHPTHEVVASTCLAMLLIATGRAPLKKNAARAAMLLETAKRLDTSLSAVKALEPTCFRWAPLVAPLDAMAMAIYAVFAEVVLEDIDKAELLYRRALALDPGHAVTVDNYATLVEARTPRGRYAPAGPGRVALQRAYVVETIGEWQHLRDSQTNATFWCHAKTKQVQWDPPSS